MPPPQPVPAHHLWPSSSARRDSVSNPRSGLRIPSATRAVFGLLRSWPGAATVSLSARARSPHSPGFPELGLGRASQQSKAAFPCSSREVHGLAPLVVPAAEGYRCRFVLLGFPSRARQSDIQTADTDIAVEGDHPGAVRRSNSVQRKEWLWPESFPASGPSLAMRSG